jgi:hypothetical protein
MKLFPLTYKVSFVFCSFLCVSLYVLVSFFSPYGNFFRNEKNSLTHWNLHTEISKIQTNFICIWGKFSYSPCNILRNFTSKSFHLKIGKSQKSTRALNIIFPKNFPKFMSKKFPFSLENLKILINLLWMWNFFLLHN